MTTTAQPTRRVRDDGTLPVGVPDLDEVAGEWVDAAELAHLPSLRNQQGQGHVNHDLTSLSWLAAPPYSFGYHTGVLRVDGVVPDAQRFRWKPWGVQREHRGERVSVRTDTRMALSRNLLLWRVQVTNEQDSAATYTVTQDLFALLTATEVGWGWLYDVPWTNGDHHDFITLERIRDATRPARDGAPYLLGPGPRRVRLGRPRLPGIQRDEDRAPMLMQYELPRHVSEDTVYPHRDAARGGIRNLHCGPADGGTVFEFADPVELEPTTRVDLDGFELRDGLVLSFEFRPDTLTEPGVILTHGNHPDSLQLGIDADGLWFGISGEVEHADTPLVTGAWHRIAVLLTNHRVTLLLDGTPVATTTEHWSRSRRWGTTITDGVAVTADTHSAARAAYAFSTAPGDLSVTGAGARATWSLALAPGETRTLGVVCAYGTDPAEVTGAARGAAATFDETMAETEYGIRRHWRNMFTPDNGDFSGHLPTFRADDPQLGRAYYMGALLVLYMRNLNASPTEPVFLTGGPRLGPTTTFYWDHSEWSRMYALLEPVGLRAWLLRALGGPYRDSFGFDTRRGGPLGNEYASTDLSLFRLVEHYVCVTGDLGFLDERAGSATVADHVERLAYGWRDRRRTATGGVLADFGDDAWRVLECVPNYINVIASLNAGYVTMMRSLAGLYRLRGRPDDAARAQGEAETLAAAVLDLYVDGGRWSVRHPDRTETIGHSLDFGLVASALHAELGPTRRREMVDFVTGHLLTGTWMRALAKDDPVAESSDRPDHGAGGAFGAWPGVTAHGLARLGRPDLAIGLLRLTPESASGALWGQAMEILDRDPTDIRVRVAERGVSNRDSIAGAATAEAVLAALFDFEPTFADLGTDAEPTTRHRPGVGVLSNLNVAPVRSPADAQP
ncbi:laminin G domain-containing protein [Micromonospora sp. NBC_01796]|uniref:laminin G domain-containing protein n=1 Tax=Micromonospora sp. NBC_01796 TaxID=2975987 RepID=UPI002DD80B60|nr:laminin G domain-containing protein [Micromonospora sp. NBC_01796]WSA84579.1 laminin G domain-containing protein [Micromonospora sp. NBC_01796]